MDNEDIFNINSALKTVYSNVLQTQKESDTELIIEMGKTIPREMRGNDETLIALLSKLSETIIHVTEAAEILLSISTSDDFFYEEFVSFRFSHTGLDHDAIVDIFDEGLSSLLNKVEGEIVDVAGAELALNIPLRIHELGFRRHYRLSDDKMLEKKVLVVSQSEILTHCIKNYLTYFNYQVDTGVEKLNQLKSYDLLIADPEVLSKTTMKIVLEIQRHEKMFCAWIGKKPSGTVEPLSALLNKPLLQETFWKLIESLFAEEELVKASLDIDTTDQVHTRLLYEELEEKEAEALPILNTESGLLMNDTEETYRLSLENFLKNYQESDVLFRKLVMEQKYKTLETLANEIENRASMIGAESMVNVMECIALIMSHNQTDLLDIYPLKFRIALLQLTQKINDYL